MRPRQLGGAFSSRWHREPLQFPWANNHVMGGGGRRSLSGSCCPSSPRAGVHRRLLRAPQAASGELWRRAVRLHRQPRDGVLCSPTFLSPRLVSTGQAPAAARMTTPLYLMRTQSAHAAGADTFVHPTRPAAGACPCSLRLAPRHLRFGHLHNPPAPAPAAPPAPRAGDGAEGQGGGDGDEARGAPLHADAGEEHPPED